MGNNNAYCQDNPISWLNWNLQPQDRDLLTFVQRMINLRKRHPVFRRRRFFQGRPIKGATVKDVLWLNPSGNEMSEDEWRDPSLHCLGMFLSGQGLDETDERGRKLSDENFLRAAQRLPRGYGIHFAGVPSWCPLDRMDGHFS